MVIRVSQHTAVSLLGLFLLCVAVFWYEYTKAAPMVRAETLSNEALRETGDFFFNIGDNPGRTYDLDKARYYYTALLVRESKTNWYPYYQIGRIDFLEGNLKSAVWYFEKQLTSFSDTPPNAYYMLGLSYGYLARVSGEDYNWQKAEEAFKKAIFHLPIDPWPRVDLAWVYFAQGKYEEMKAPLEEVLDSYSDNAWILNMYGLALFNSGDRESARLYFERARDEANLLSEADWGRAYPGNDPDNWSEGLEEMRESIEANVRLASE